MEFLTQAALQASGVVLLVQQILKDKVIPLKFANDHPVPTNIVLSVLATLWLVPLTWDWSNWQQVLVQVGTVAVVAALAYNQLLGKSHEVKSREG